MPPRRLSTARRARPASRARRPTPSASPAAEGRERILAVAIRSFSEVGYEGTTTAGIARDAEVTQPLVHHHFGSKEGLWRAAMDIVFGNLPDVATRPLPESPAEALLSLVRDFIRFVAAHPEATRIVAREGAKPSPRLDYLVEHYLGRPFNDILALVRIGQRAGVVAPEIRPDLLLFLILGAGSHLFDVTAFARRSIGLDVAAPQTRDDFIALVSELLEHGLVRRDKARRRP